MKILFVYSLDNINTPSKPLTTPEQMQFGISYISAFLKERGHETRLMVLVKSLGNRNMETVKKCLEEFRPQLICFTAVSSEYRFMAEIAGYIKKKYPKIYLLAGGVHVSLNPNDAIGDHFNALCVGEGEQAVYELVEQLQKGVIPSRIPNLWFKCDGKVEKNPPRLFIENLDRLPFPDRQMWEEWIEERPGAEYPVLLGRGCPFECAYCSNHALKKIGAGAYVRFRSTDNIMAEIRQISRQFPAKKEIYLEIESFGVNKDWALELCMNLERLNSTLTRPLAFRVNLRITSQPDFEGLFAACQKANFSAINIGLESGSERVRKAILRRSYSNQDVINTVTLARKYGLKIAFFNMIGLPGETILDFKETVAINRRCLPDQHYTSIFFPYPGTDLYHKCEKRELLGSHRDVEMERSRATLSLPGFSKRQIQKSYIFFDYYVFKGHKPMRKIADRVIVSACMSNRILYHVYLKIRRLPLFSFIKKMARR
ncbi:MAG TPA: hypothetical protein DCL49_13230 [Candidatus Omnitrophica bacterium]|nr:hypothetical protein [Candidatus Omnitrophota bacterium]